MGKGDDELRSVEGKKSCKAIFFLYYLPKMCRVLWEKLRRAAGTGVKANGEELESDSELFVFRVWWHLLDFCFSNIADE